MSKLDTERSNHGEKIPYPVIDMKQTGENIRKIREEQNISVIEVQYFLGISNPQAIYQWQKGISLLSVDHLCALSHLFDVPMNDILVLADTPESNPHAMLRIAKRVPMTARKLILFTAA